MMLLESPNPVPTGTPHRIGIRRSPDLAVSFIPFKTACRKPQVPRGLPQSFRDHSRSFRECFLLKIASASFRSTIVSIFLAISLPRTQRELPRSMYLEPETSIKKWLFPLDESKSLHEKWLFHQTTTKKWLFGVPGRNRICWFWSQIWT